MGAIDVVVHGASPLLLPPTAILVPALSSYREAREENKFDMWVPLGNLYGLGVFWSVQKYIIKKT